MFQDYFLRGQVWQGLCKEVKYQFEEYMGYAE